MAKGIFGERLKREREMREVSLAEVTRGTRIAQRFVEALENEAWDALPGGVFSRGFVRSIARYLGLNEEELLSEYDLARGGAQPFPTPAPYQNQLPSLPKWIPAVAIVAVLALSIGLFYGGRYLWRRYADYRAAHPHASSLQQLAAVSGATTPSGRLELSVSTSMASHVRIQADNQVLLDADVLPGDTHHFTAAHQFQITAADGAAVHLELNGRPITARAALGNSSRTSDTIVLGYKDLRPPNDGTVRP
jgi:cytoskeleton protein RodZ